MNKVLTVGLLLIVLPLLPVFWLMATIEEATDNFNPKIHEENIDLYKFNPKIINR